MLNETLVLVRANENSAQASVSYRLFADHFLSIEEMADAKGWPYKKL